MKLAWTALLLAAPALAQCHDLDYNNDGVWPSDQDTTDFSNVLAGADCPTCDSIDFNGDGVFPDERDYTDWLAVLAGGPCSNGGFTPVVCPGCPRVVVAEGVSPATVIGTLPRVTGSDGSVGTPAIVELPYHTTEYSGAINWPGMDGLAYGGLAGRPLIIRGIPGPNGERPTLRLPSTVGAGVRIVGGLHDVQIRGLRLVGDGHGAIVAIQGDAGNVLIEDCELVGGVIGIKLESQSNNLGAVRIRRNIIHGQRSTNGRAQCLYASGDKLTIIEQNVFNATRDRSNESQGIYSVYGDKDNIIIGNWFFNIFGAGAQMRGGRFTFQSNVMRNNGTMGGAGHPMAWQYRIWTDANISNNLLSKSNPESAAQWGFGAGLCRPCVFNANIFEQVSRPWVPFSEQLGETTGGVLINTIPVGDLIRVGNIYRQTPADIDWEATERMQMTRPANVWGPQYETGTVIERSKN